MIEIVLIITFNKLFMNKFFKSLFYEMIEQVYVSKLRIR